MRLTLSRKLLLLVAAIGVLFSGIVVLDALNLRKLMYRGKETQLRAQVETMVSLVEGFVAAAETGTMREELAKANAITAISSIRYGAGDYAFIVDERAIVLSHPMPSQVGRDLWDTADADGKLFLREMIARAQDGGGSTAYLWPRPDDDAPVEKLSYTMLVPDWGWVVGTGLYIDDIEAELGREIVEGSLLILIGTALAMALAFAVSRSVTRPLSALTASIRDLRKGTATSGLCAGRRDEIGVLAVEILALQDALVERARAEAETIRRRDAEAAELRQQAAAETHARAVDQAERERRDLEADRARDAAETERDRREAMSMRAAAEAQEFVVREVGHGLMRLADGDLSRPIVTAFPAGYEELRTNYNTALAGLQQVVATLTRATGTVRTNATGLSEASGELSCRTDRQAAHLQATATSLHEVAATERQIADTADIARAVASEMREDAERFGQEVERVVDAMGMIKGSVDEVRSIIRVVDDIASQTMILALNAGVEAARAGEAGQGFAVIAQEVRRLAMRTSDAAREITALTVVSMRQVDDGAKLVDIADQSLARILGEIAGIHGSIVRISAATEKQASGLAETEIAIADVSQATQANAAMADRTTRVVADVLEEIEGLATLVERFRLGTSLDVRAA